MRLSIEEWAAENGIKINGVAPAKFPGRGFGLQAMTGNEV